MTHKKYEWKGLDGIRLFGQSWSPDQKPRAVINYVHGFKDYSERFEKWALRLVENGYAVIAIDLRGHGYSDGRRGYAPGFNSYLNDVHVLRQNAIQLFPNLFHVLYGHSLGGNLVTNYLINHSLIPDAGVISSPWFTLAVSPSWIKFAMAHIMKHILPRMLVKSDLEASYLSHDPEVVQKYMSDPLVHQTILPKLFLEIEVNGLKASTSIYKINIPLLVMHGGSDSITSVKQTRQFVFNASKKTTYKEWPDGFHELHNEYFEAEVFQFLLDWLNKVVRK